MGLAHNAPTKKGNDYARNAAVVSIESGTDFSEIFMSDTLKFSVERF